MNSAPSDNKILTWTTKQVVLTTIFVVCVFLSFWLLYRLRLVIFLFFVAAILGTALRPTVDWLHRRFGFSRLAGVVIIYALIGVALTGFFYLVLPLLADQVTQVSQNLPEYYLKMRNGLVSSSNRLLQIVGGRFPSRLSFLAASTTDATAEEVIDRVGQTLLYFNLTAKSLFSISAALLLAFYWTLESNRVLRSLFLLIPLARRKGVREFIQLAETKMGGYVRGQGILSLAVGSAALISYTLIGLPYTLVLAIIAGLMEMIPVFGPALGAIPALLVALSVDPSKAVWVLVATGIIQVLENAFLVPRIMKSSMGVNPIIILLSLVGFSSVLGFVGALLALPLAAIIQLVIDRVVLDAAIAQAEPIRGELESFIDEGQRLLQQMDGASGPKNAALTALPDLAQAEVRTIVRDLDGLLKQLKTEEE